mmetsp:Transcript_14275/g.34334  ORF Transcript_14275/g.34334 Transcript_14275/m.34334 type:complete len:530 (-) Transcript_14275:190-1779(-)
MMMMNRQLLGALNSRSNRPSSPSPSSSSVSTRPPNRSAAVAAGGISAVAVSVDIPLRRRPLHRHRTLDTHTPNATTTQRFRRRSSLSPLSESFTRDDADADIEALAAARDAASAAYLRAIVARDASSSASASYDEAEVRYNASPYANVSCDYGFIQSNAGLYIDVSSTRLPGVPKSALASGVGNFKREWAAMRAAMRGENNVAGNGLTPILVPSEAWSGTSDEAELVSELRDQLSELEMSNAGVWARHHARPEVPAPWIIKAPYYAVTWFLDAAFPENQPFRRFWFLETVARMPYFSYNTMLTLYEILGWWRRSSELRRVHFAEEWNEYHHLLIMESLGGDRLWRDRFLAQHSALVYYFVLMGLWLVSPALAYNFSELIEAHAVDTYAQFADQNKHILRELPAPRIAKAYYENEDLYLFDEFQTARPRSSRRPVMRHLHDVFCAIRDDEGEHVATMQECQVENIGTPAAVNLGTAAVLVFIATNTWLQRLGEEAGMSGFEVDGLQVGESGLEDGFIAALFRLFSFLPFL